MYCKLLYSELNTLAMPNMWIQSFQLFSYNYKNNLYSRKF